MRGQDEHVKILNDLISTCLDSEEGFRKAAKGAHSDELREHLMKFAQQRQDFARELQEWVRRLNAKPAEQGHAGGVLHRGWVDLEQRIRPKGDETLIDECARGEETTLKHYTHALEQDLPQEIREVVETQMLAIRETIEELHRLKSAIRTERELRA
jgi:uncharacterized protein (TIGR02284 family)